VPVVGFEVCKLTDCFCHGARQVLRTCFVVRGISKINGLVFCAGKPRLRPWSALPWSTSTLLSLQRQ
jgi:hypothetical protein